MASPDHLPPVGTEPPLPPAHSLPRYSEPTPETHQRISREEEAEQALTTTQFAPGAKLAVTVLFLVTIVSLPLLNLAARYRREPHQNRSPGAEVLALLPKFNELGGVRSWSDLNSILPTAGEIKTAEKNLEKDSIVSQFLLPRVQSLLTGVLHAGNEQVYPGSKGWLFYRQDVDHVTGPPFLDPARLRQRKRELALQPDPLQAIVRFRDQLQARGIELLVLPIPAKPAVECEKLGMLRPAILRNSAFIDFELGLARAGVPLVSLEEKMAAWKGQGVSANRGEPGQEALYLKTDTHWTPWAMQQTAELLAQAATPYLPGAGRPSTTLAKREVCGSGDIAAMLKLPAEQTLYPPQLVTIEQVLVGNSLWRPSLESEVLLLGDSFSNIYSLYGMGWGEGAGLAEHLSHALGRPVDCLLRNSDGAFATREMLSRELARGRDRLAGKKVVIWEFAERELSFGDWKQLPMELGQARPSTFLTVPEGVTRVIEGTVASVSEVPRPGSVTYQDHICTVHLEEVAGVGSPGANQQALVYLWSMREGHWTAVPRWRTGDRVRLRLTSWPGNDPSRTQYNRSEPASELQLEEFVWGEPVGER